METYVEKLRCPVYVWKACNFVLISVTCAALTLFSWSVLGISKQVGSSHQSDVIGSPHFTTMPSSNHLVLPIDMCPDEGDFLCNGKYGLCTVNGKPVLWTFWDYTPMPPFYKMGLDALQCHNYPDVQVFLLNQSCVFKLLPAETFPAAFNYLLEAHKADYVRCRLLLQYGGMWVDADTLAWNPLFHMFDTLVDHDVYGYTWPGEVIGITLIGPIKAQSPLLVAWQQRVDKLLTEKLPLFVAHKSMGSPYPLGWNEILGAQFQTIMRQLLSDNNGTAVLRYYKVDGPAEYGALMERQIDRILFDKLNKTTIETVLQHLAGVKASLMLFHNSNVDAKWKAMRLRQFLQQNTVLERLLKMSFERCIDRLLHQKSSTAAMLPLGLWKTWRDILQ